MNIKTSMKTIIKMNEYENYENEYKIEVII